ncbi:hypothetical protein AAMO2058_001127000 [Amorphochlora amoebiformis]
MSKPSPAEAKLIGNILAEDDADSEFRQKELEEQIDRSISAPPQMSARVRESEDGKWIDPRSGERVREDDPRLTPEYYAYYYSQRPLDPRLAPPLFNWSSKLVASKLQQRGLPDKESKNTAKTQADEHVQRILRPAGRKMFHPERLLDPRPEGEKKASLPSPFSTDSSSKPVPFQYLFSDPTDDRPPPISKQGAPSRPQSARPSESLATVASSLRLYSATPPADISSNGPMLKMLREQLRSYSQDRKATTSPPIERSGPSGGYGGYSPPREGERQTIPLNMMSRLRISENEGPSVVGSGGLGSRGGYKEKALQRGRGVGSQGQGYEGQGDSRGDSRGYGYGGYPASEYDGGSGYGGNTAYGGGSGHPTYSQYQNERQYHEERNHMGYQREYSDGGRDYGRGGRGRWNRMAPRGGGMIPRDSVHPHHELDYGSPRFRGGGGISVQNGMFVRGPHIMEETYWEPHDSRGIQDYYMMQQMGHNGMRRERFGTIGRGGRFRGGIGGGGRGRGRYGGGGGGRMRNQNHNMRGQYSGHSGHGSHGGHSGHGGRGMHNSGGRERVRGEPRGQMMPRADSKSRRFMSPAANSNLPLSAADANTIGISSNLYNKWVEEFKTNKTTHVTLEDVAKRDMVVDLAMDQYGSRFLQQKLESAPTSQKEMIFQQLYPEVQRLCSDVFGNYVIQKMLEYGTSEQKKKLAKELRGNILTLSLQMYGCRVVQKAIDVLHLDIKAELIKELHGHVMKCVRDQNGNHVIQKCIEKVPPSEIQFIVEAFRGQNVKLAMHPYGCRVIQRLLEHCSSQQRNNMLKEILDHTQGLAKNQYGNYVIQHVLIHGSARHRAAVIKSFQGILLKLSKHKFASNVIEKCVTHATRQERLSLIEEILGTDR